MKILDMPPFAPVLMESTRAMGYNLEAAIADIIDNSIAAGAGNIYIDFSPYDAVPFVSILDDGEGMSETQINAGASLGRRLPGGSSPAGQVLAGWAGCAPGR